VNSAETRQQFVQIIESNKGIIYKVANAYCRNAEDRKDLVQEIIIQLWNAFDRYDHSYKLSTWMYRIALNVTISHYRKSITREALTQPLTDDMINIANDSQHGQLEADITSLQKFIAELNELDKALMLLYLEENSYREIAEILGITETNVASKINRIKEKLKQKFKTLNN
jgi:RNA polymerase sigma factor (sigma-70 family)